MVIKRSFDGELFKEALARAPQGMNEGFDHQAHLDNHDHIMLVNDKGDVGFLCCEYPGVYTGHWFYNSRGKEALEVGRQMLDHVFTNYPVKVIRGLTKRDILGARWLARKVGFTSFGLLLMDDGEYELFCLTKEDFYKKDNEIG